MDSGHFIGIEIKVARMTFVMNQYQLTVVISNKLDEKERTELLSSLSQKMGEVKKEDLWGMRSLAYPIKHQDKAFYANYEFEAEPSSISALDKNIKLNEDILRYLLIRR